MQNHEYGIPPDHYNRWPLLGEWFKVLTTSKDRKGLEYISTVEAKKYPFTGGVHIDEQYKVTWLCGCCHTNERRKVHETHIV